MDRFQRKAIEYRSWEIHGVTVGSLRDLIFILTFLHGVHLLLIHGLENGEDEFLALIPRLLDLPGEGVGVIVATGELEVLADVARIIHQAELGNDGRVRICQLRVRECLGQTKSRGTASSEREPKSARWENSRIPRRSGPRGCSPREQRWAPAMDEVSEVQWCSS